MKNINLLINALMDIMDYENEQFERISIDDGGATEESEINYHINCPYFGGDERALCHNRENDIGRELCVECKSKWLLQEVDK